MGSMRDSNDRIAFRHTDGWVHHQLESAPIVDELTTVSHSVTTNEAGVKRSRHRGGVSTTVLKIEDLD